MYVPGQPIGNLGSFLGRLLDVPCGATEAYGASVSVASYTGALELQGQGGLQGSSDLIAPQVPEDVNLPGTAVGSYTAIACLPGEINTGPLANCSGPVVADIGLDLPGTVTLYFAFGDVYAVGFTSSPEPSTILLMLLGTAALAACCLKRRSHSS